MITHSTHLGELSMIPRLLTGNILFSVLFASCADEQAIATAQGDTSTGSLPQTSTEDLDPPVTPTSNPLPATDTADELTTSTTGSTTQIDDETNTTTGPLTPVCGDGIVDPGEECDNSFEYNILNGACLPDCHSAECGDGFVNTGAEECDMGPANSKDYAGCNDTTCKWNSRCGDGIVDPAHEYCDPGAPGDRGDDTVACANNCRFAGRIVFLSSLKFDGNLGGLAGADEKCQQLAAHFDPEFAHTYVAWLGDTGMSALSRISPNALPLILRNGLELAADLEELVATGPSPGILLTDDDQTLINLEVWTDADFTGALFNSSHCEGWGSNAPALTARYGINAQLEGTPAHDAWVAGHHWTSKDNGSCWNKRHLYCFENSPGQP